MCEVNFITQFNMIMEYCRENCVHSRERMLMIALFHCANRVAQQNVNHEWPDGFFPISNVELNSWCDLDKKAIHDLRNSLKQRGLIDFINGERNKLPPQYKINYLVFEGYRIVPRKTEKVGCKKTPNNTTNSTTNDHTNSTTNDNPNTGANDTTFSININTKVNEIQSTHTLQKKQTEERVTREDSDSERFDPADPNDLDTGWMDSNRVRCAIAQRLVNHHMQRLRRGFYVADSGSVLQDNDGIDVLCDAMKQRIPPAQIDRLARGSQEAWEWLANVKMAAISRGYAPQEWIDMRLDIESALREMREERKTC